MMRRFRTSASGEPVIDGARILLRMLDARDFEMWREVRLANREWLEPWEPAPERGAPDAVRDPQHFRNRCAALVRQRQLDSTYQFGVFKVGGVLIGEVSLQNVQRGAAQSATLGYWVDSRQAGHGYIPEACILAFRCAFDQLGLHRVEVAIVPRNTRSRRVVEKLALRNEGIAVRFLQINGEWEDHVRYAITLEEWHERRDELIRDFVGPR